MTKQILLTVSDHNRDVSHLRYIYPVVSRRAQGVSIGINLNVNNACNWRCIYCQVPNLTRGAPPPIDLILLERELEFMLNSVLHGDFMQTFVAERDRQLQDIAFSGNGEPTSAKEFPKVVAIVEKLLHQFNLFGKIKLRLITNGSLVDKASVIKSLQQLAQCNGEVWFKVDAGTVVGFSRMNDVSLLPQSHIQRLIKCAEVCPTYIQTCMLAIDGLPPTEADIEAYLAFVQQVSNKVKGVYLYGLARPSMQIEAPRLNQLPLDWLDSVAKRIRQLNVEVFVSY